MDKADKMLLLLEPEIENKCSEIRQRKRERLATRLFILLGAAILTVPTLLVFMGISFLTVLMPLILIGAVFMLLSPILFNRGGALV